MEQRHGPAHQSHRRVSSLPPTLRRVAPAVSERPRAIPRVGDIWVPKSEISPNHFVRLFTWNRRFVSGRRSIDSGGAQWFQISHH
jgi:hypothetical protein